MLVRLTRISGADLNVFDFDYDLNFVGFFLNADEKVYGRYGGRDAASAEGRLSLLGLRYAMSAALAAHRQQPKGGAVPGPQKKPLLVDDYPAAKLLNAKACIHCHQVNEFRRAARQAEGKWQREEVWAYPLPENVGLTLDIDQGNRVRAVRPGSPADKVGLRPADVLRGLNGFPVASIADVQYGLHRAPWKGPVAVSWTRGDQARTGTLNLTEGWRKTNLTWRPSLLDVLPSLSVYGKDLSAAEKKALGLPERRLAFRQDDSVAEDAQTAGVRVGDIILGLKGESPEMTMLEFLAHVRRNYLVGDRITLEVIRDGKKRELPLTLR